MNPDLGPLRELGEWLAPRTDQPPADLRRRVLTRVATAGPRSVRVTAMAAAVVALVLAGVNAGGPPVRPVAETPARVLELAASRAAAAPAPLIRSDGFVFTEWIEVRQRLAMDRWVPESSLGSPVVVRQWRSVDGTRDGLTRRRAAGATEGAWLNTVVPACCGLAALPTDGDAMYAHLFRPSDPGSQGLGAFVGPEVLALNRAADVLRLGGLSPPVQAAVFDAVGRIRGVRIRNGAVDVSGRTGVALVHAEPDVETELIFDATTYRYLGMNQRITALRTIHKEDGELTVNDAPVRQAILRVAMVDEIGELP